MAQPTTLDWQRIVADPRFQALHRKKTTFLWGLMIFSIVYYFMGAGRSPTGTSRWAR